MSKSKKTLPSLSPGAWVLLKAAFLQIMSTTGTRNLALIRINEDLRSGRLGSALVESDGKEALLDKSDWQQRTVHAVGNPEEGVWVEPHVDGRSYYVWAVDLYERYKPTMTAAPQSDDTKSSPPTTPASEKQKPGIRPFKDWPNRLLAPEMVRVAYETPDLLRDRPELVRHVRKFLQDEIGWEPSDNKPIYRELDRLLSRIK